jgi:ABC-type dipeptide/oligopeptide/nickel transport system permease component
MTRVLAQRLLHGVFLLIGVSILTFVFTELAPGDFFDDLALDPQVSAETADELRARFGLDDPLPSRYLRWLGSVLQGDLGYSMAYNQPVAPLLWQRAKNTLLLTVTATVIAWLAAVPLGIWAAERRGFGRTLFGGLTSMGLAIPDLVLGLAFLMLAVRTDLLPTGGMTSFDFETLSLWQKIFDIGRHLLLPVTALVLTTIPSIARHVQSSVAEVMASPFVSAVRARGISRRRLLYRHALPVAANPVISLFGLSVAGLLSASLLIEYIMSWPGIGDLLLRAIQARDIYVVIGAVMASTVFLTLGNLLADLLLVTADPRIRSPQA